MVYTLSVHVVYAVSRRTMSYEYEHIKAWATANKMVINMSKTKELFSTGHTQVDLICRQLLTISSKLKLLSFLELCFLVT